MSVPAGLKYTKDHEWLRQEGDCAVCGITDHAQEALGDIVFVELPAIGRKLEAGKPCGVVESVKAVSDVYAPAGGEVVEANQKLDAQPELINSDPYGEGWMVKIRLQNPADLSALMDAGAYAAFLSSES